MTIPWTSLAGVFVVALGSTVVVVVLVTVALLALSARTAGPCVPLRRRRLPSAVTAMVVGSCLAAAAAIVLLGLWATVAG